MGKAVLVMDMPKNCAECSLCGTSYDEYFCIPDDFTHYLGDSYVNHSCESRPDWCPLRELPKKKDSMNLNSIMEKCKDRDSIMDSVLKQFIVDGYNACIDELLADKE